MKKQTLLKIINPLLGLLVLNQAVTGMLHDVMPYELFELLHKGGWLMLIIAAIHCYLNWGWVKANLFPARKK